MSSQWLPRLSFLQSLRQSHFTLPVRPEFLASSAFQFVNPRHHVIATDNVTQTFPESVVAGLSDEEALALFTRGFFGGFVFGLERSVLRMGGWNLLPARYTGFEGDPHASQIWNISELPRNRLLPVGSTLFGSFKVMDKQIEPESSDQRASYVDYGFGSDEFTFAGCHRFQITRSPRIGAEPLVQFELQHFRCNPQKNEPSVAEYIAWFHYVYAKSLFGNAVQSVLLR
ncbi:hypothetical protein PEX1_041730 [Penicillium expansum]|uniref:Uncharacterized protein n=1 Tax=Penicillium expansum TaxID=27334 RepID=A0A0A2IX11_PENEN|nr:hypothetical protein PEX2_090820 [Penicillium expansum]KGO47589.1 hypothetical protein PEXP_014760 [Penicillium expansum]KGO54829.1 hypothetical protein PEX2_090820 [Penicillium expansum]KGO70138.1 hypothetical protein PEX1_041730 [Penicillium expansum]